MKPRYVLEDLSIKSAQQTPKRSTTHPNIQTFAAVNAVLKPLSTAPIRAGIPYGPARLIQAVNYQRIAQRSVNIESPRQTVIAPSIDSDSPSADTATYVSRWINIIGFF